MRFREDNLGERGVSAVKDSRSSELPAASCEPRTASHESGRWLKARSSKRGAPHRGFTLIEMIVATGILLILTGLALPLVKLEVKRERERELRYDLWTMRDAIDRYKDAADRGAFQIKVDSMGYPPDMDKLVEGEDVAGKKLKFLRKIPIDPMTGKAEWGMRSMQDDATSESWGGQNVFDVYSKSPDQALDGTYYKDW
jgi:general secretion pathway protein G